MDELTRPPALIRVLHSVSSVFANIFGYILLTLVILVTIEAFGRKLFGFSLQGVDELGGYALAIGSSLAFTVALVHRAHIRIELFHQLLPGAFQVILNWASIVLLAGFGALLAWVCYAILLDTIAYHSTAPTPWATPLVWPQSIWYASLVMFAAAATAMALHATYLLLRGRGQALNMLYGPKAMAEELSSELEDANRR